MNIHTILARIVLTVFPLLVVVGVIAFIRYVRGYAVPGDTDIFEVVEGRWTWTTADDPCGSDWHDISFSAGRDSMFIANFESFEGADGVYDSITPYVVHEHNRRRIRASIPGDTRHTEAGDPVVWDLVLRSPDRYAWHRTDWLPGEFTAPIARCPSTPDG